MPRPRKPNAALGRLERLIGVWKIEGRKFDSDHDNVSGQVTIEWLPGGLRWGPKKDASEHLRRSHDAHPVCGPMTAKVTQPALK